MIRDWRKDNAQSNRRFYFECVLSRIINVEVIHYGAGTENFIWKDKYEFCEE